MAADGYQISFSLKKAALALKQLASVTSPQMYWEKKSTAVLGIHAVHYITVPLFWHN